MIRNFIYPLLALGLVGGASYGGWWLKVNDIGLTETVDGDGVSLRQASTQGNGLFFVGYGRVHQGGGLRGGK